MAQGLGGDLYVLYLDLGKELDSDQWKSLEESLRFAESLGAHVVRASGSNLIKGIREFIREQHITQVILGRLCVRAGVGFGPSRRSRACYALVRGWMFTLLPWIPANEPGMTSRVEVTRRSSGNRSRLRRNQFAL